MRSQQKPTEALIGWMPYGDEATVASARMRCFAPLRALQAQGFPVEEYNAENRFRYRVVVFQKCYDAVHVQIAQQAQKAGVQVVFDMCDNHLYNPHQIPEFETQARCLRQMLCLADHVTVSTATLAEILGAPQATVIPDCLDTVPVRARASCYVGQAVRRLRHGVPNQTLNLIWFGIWGSARAPFGMCDLARIVPELGECARRGPVRLTVVSNSAEAFAKWGRISPVPSRYVAWHGVAHLYQLLARHDLCVIPVTPNPYTLGKSANRLLTALDAGIPTVADTLPAYQEFAPYAVLEDWQTGLVEFRQHHAERARQARRGQKQVQALFSIGRVAAQWRTFFEGLLT